MALVKAKKEKHLTNFDNVDRQDQFEFVIINWKKISEFVMNLGFKTHLMNGLACKGKWSSIFGHIKKIYDYMASIGHNEEF